MHRAQGCSPDPDPRERALAHQLGLPDLLARVLLARGIDDPQRIRAHLRPDLGALCDPFQFRAMPKAVDRIRTAVRNGEPIMVHGDYDVDGITGTVLLLRFFGLMQATVKPFIPQRCNGYSFSDASVRAVAEGGFKLVISVDNGTNACEPIKRIQAMGCDVIVTDHHGTSDHVAEAFAVLNPRLPDAGYPDRNLAGVGVAFRLAAAVAASFSGGMLRSPEFAEFLADALTLVALGTVADVAPLQGENRALVFHGMRSLCQSRSPGIRALLDSAGLTARSPEVEDIAFRIAPLLNAAGRMGNAQEAVALLMARSYADAQNAAKVLEKHNTERRKVERKLQDTVLEQVVAGPDPAVVLGGDDWHPGVLGIVAARIAEQTGKPTILISFAEEVGRGSGRCTGGIHLRNALAACADCLVSHGGHAAAAGLEVRRERFEEFRARFQEACMRLMAEAVPVPVDGWSDFAELDPTTVRKLDLLGPFGNGNRRPRFRTAGVRTVGWPHQDTRGQDLKVRLVHAGTLLPARVLGAAARFEELRNSQGLWTATWSPRLNPRAEEGPIQLDVHELVADGARAG
jgi:single-stranded-DNA-specific exonuclease